MESKNPIVYRTTPIRAASPDSVEIVNAVFWPTGAERRVRRGRPADAIEASMLPSTRRLQPRLPIAELEVPYLRYLDQRILRRPRDLKAHVRRIVMLTERGDPDKLAGALADLYLALGENGQRLRRRMLAMVEARLRPEHRRYFRDRDALIADDSRPAPVTDASLLARHSVTARPIVVPPGSHELSAMELVKRALKRGNAVHGMELLECMLDADPGSEAVCKALLDIYEDSRFARRMLRTYTRFLGRPLALRDRWIRLQERYLEMCGKTSRRNQTLLPDLAARA